MPTLTQGGHGSRVAPSAWCIWVAAGADPQEGALPPGSRGRCPPWGARRGGAGPKVQLSSPPDEPSWRGRDSRGPPSFSKRLWGTRPRACPDTAPSLAEGHWPQGPHSGHAEERGVVGSRHDESGLREPRDQFAREHGASVLTLDRVASAKLEGTRLWLRRKAQPRALVAGQGALGAPSRGYSEAGEGEVRALGRSGPGRPRDSPKHRLRALQGPRGHSERRPRTCERRGASVGAQGPQPGPFPPGPPPVWVQGRQSVFPPPCPRGSGAQRGQGTRPIRPGEEVPGRQPQLPSLPRWRN